MTSSRPPPYRLTVLLSWVALTGLSMGTSDTSLTAAQDLLKRGNSDEWHVVVPAKEEREEHMDHW